MPTPGPLELVIILVIALIILGPGKLPDVGASLGKSIREFRKASSDIQESVTVKVDTSPLPPTPAAPVVQAPVVTSAAATVPDAQARIAELERQLAETRTQSQESGTPGAAGTASGDSGSEASS